MIYIELLLMADRKQLAILMCIPATLGLVKAQVLIRRSGTGPGILHFSKLVDTACAASRHTTNTKTTKRLNSVM